MKYSNEEQVEALRALIISDGWHVLREHAMAVHAPDKVLDRLGAAMQNAPDANRYGAQAAAMVSESRAIKGVFELPQALIDVLSREEGGD